MRIKEIISEDVMRASGGQQPAVMPPIPVYPQPPRPSVPPQPHLPTPRPPNASVTPAHRPPPPHAGVGTSLLTLGLSGGCVPVLFLTRLCALLLG